MKAAFQEQLTLLCELQEIDLTLHNLEQQLASLPDAIRGLEMTYNAVKGDLEGARAELAEVEKARRNDESELATSVDHMRTRESRLYAIKTNKEYQAALKEISEGKRINREREDRILQAMEKIESLTKNITQLEKDFADKEVAYSQKQEAIKVEESAIRGKMSADTVRRPDVVAKIDKKIMRKYDFVRQRYAQAMAGVTDGVCQGCSTRIPPQLFNEMLRREDFKVCPSCQRLLFVVVEEPAEEKTGA